MDDNELPSENETVKNGTKNRTLLTLSIIINIVIAIKILINKKINHDNETLAAIPIVITQKYTESSNGDLTGFLNLTIDRAPTIPKDSAILPDMTLVIIKAIKGNVKKTIA